MSYKHPNFAIDEKIDKTIAKHFEKLVQIEMQKIKNYVLTKEMKRCLAVEKVLVKKEKCKLKMKWRSIRLKTTEERKRKSGNGSRLLKLCLIKQHRMSQIQKLGNNKHTRN